MKKIFGILIIAAQLISFGSASAANGDMAGYVYDTDIKAFINGIEVPSYSIGGKTAVAIEDITKPNSGHYYNDSSRTLQLYTLAPDSLIGGKCELKGKIGDVVGRIYETDIKTVIYDYEIPSYNIGGKMAVALEDLGNDGSFSEIGGKYIWDGENRTISLEFIYDNSLMTYDYNINMRVDMNGDLSEGVVAFAGNPYCKAMLEKDFNWPEWIDDLNGTDVPVKKAIPLTFNGEVIGYHLYRTTEKSHWKPNGFYAYTYLYEDKISKIAETVESPVITKEDVINHYQNNHMGSIQERFDTEDYTFAFMSAGTPHGGTHYLVLAGADGSYHNYAEDFQSVSFWGTKLFENVTIDRENEKVYFHYDVDYEIDLKTGELIKLG
ncbi:MAG: hypothetical protein IJ300_06565 [Clostridia bacterium]|nr:hypothetical protein [Clostridia bacterium]